ncbi:MAG TPA: hypothetical protein VLH08_01705, partial [Acidobacteriota bacterium]|nr:hypothetical protein [Acidobacteriota bacterium]
MFDNVMRLEFRKQRQDFLVVVGFATAVLLCFVLEALIRNRNVTEVLKDVLVFVSMGLVLVLALTSANSARNLRTEPYKAAEELLPFSPIQKTLGAYLVNVVYLAAGSSLFLLSVYVFTAERNINWLPLSILLIIHFHLLCFLFSYWLNQTILAVIISGLLVWCESAIIGQKVFFVLFFSDPDLLHKPLHSFWSFLSFVISITGGLVALAIISTRIERQRRVRWMPGILAFIILLSGSFLLFIDLLSSSYTVQKRLMPGEYYYSWIYEVLERSPDHERTGAYFFSLTGSIVRVSPQDRQVLREVPLRFVPKPAQDLINVYEAPDHTGFWTLIKREENKYEIWNSRDGKKLKLYTRFTSKVVKPYYILKCETSLCVYGNKERNIAHAMINTNGLSEWHETEPRNYKLLLVGKIRDEVFEPEIEAGRAAVISSDLRKVTRQLKNGAVQEWVLPGKAEVPRSMGSVLMPAFHKDGEPIFALPVTSDNKTSLVIC